MLFGIREICDVVFKAKSTHMIGNKKFFKGEPVIYFDSLKTSTLEGAATTVYAQGGRGNARLIAWEGDRTLTFTMEDALISPIGISILTGAGLITPKTGEPIYVHATEKVELETGDVTANAVTLNGLKGTPVSKTDKAAADIYVMILKDGEVDSEPYIGTVVDSKVVIKAETGYTPDLTKFHAGDVVLVDYYVAKTGEGVMQIEIEAGKFGGNFYVEASTLFRNQDGVDMPAEFIIPNAKVQSNFTFTMAASGDPSTFTFTMDAFPDETKFNPKKKVLAAIQVITEGEDGIDEKRVATYHDVAQHGKVEDETQG